MRVLTSEATRITLEINFKLHTAEEIRALFSELTGKPVDDGFVLYPPFYTGSGRNITVGKNVFINMGCSFQDFGGISIGDGCLIGHNAMLTTLNHDPCPDRRTTMLPKPIVIGRNVWLGANVTVLPGVTIGDGAIIGAASVVTHDVPSRAVVAGNPARLLRMLTDEECR